MEEHGFRDLSEYAYWLFVALSVIGLADGIYTSTRVILTEFTVIVPYTFALLLGLIGLLGENWVKVPISLIAILGLVLNIMETIEKFNAKDAAEVMLFAMIILLIGPVKRSSSESKAEQ